MAIWVNADEMIERLKWDFDDQYAESILGDVASFNADMVEVVRCKDCKHYMLWEDSDENKTCAKAIGLMVSDPEDFCSYGERKIP